MRHGVFVSEADYLSHLSDETEFVVALC